MSMGQTISGHRSASIAYFVPRVSQRVKRALAEQHITTVAAGTKLVKAAVEVQQKEFMFEGTCHISLPVA